MRSPIAALALIGAATTLALTGVAAPADAATVHPADTCHYTINGNNVNIRYGPGTEYNVYTTKNNGTPVTGPGPCGATVYNDGYGWVELTRGDGGGYVWVAAPFVN